MEDKILTIPAVALRGMTILPGMVAHFDISRDKSLRAVEEAMKGDQKLFIVTQKDTEKEDPQGEDLYEVGLLAVVRQVVKLQKNIMRVLIEGIGRAEIYEYTQTADYMQARVIVYDQEDASGAGKVCNAFECAGNVCKICKSTWQNRAGCDAPGSGRDGSFKTS